MDNAIEIPIRDLVSGMVVSQDVRDKRGRLLLRANKKITRTMLKRIREFKVPSVFIYLNSYNTVLDKVVQERSLEPKEFQGIDEIVRTPKTVILKSKDEMNVHNAFFMQMGTLVANCAKETFRADIDLAEVKKMVLRAVCNKEVLNLLMNLRVKAKYLLNHSAEVALLCAVIGLESGLDETRVKNLILAAFLHDIGMTRISDSILFKTSSLEDEEIKILREHAAKSVAMLGEMEKLDKEVLEIICQHHERSNGSGYPKGLTEGVINECARILSVCDVYSAISHDRCYRERISPLEKIEFFFGSGSHYFNYETVKILLRKVSIYHKGQWVKLSTGQIGIISGIDEKYPTRPFVKLVYDENGEFILRSKEIYLGDRENATLFIDSII